MTEQTVPASGMAKLAFALAKAQGEFPAIPKNRTGKIQPKDQSKQGFEFKYADLEAVIAATRPALTKNGLAVYQQIDNDTLRTVLIHESGEQLVSEIIIGGPRDYPEIKHFGIMVSYIRRYQYQSLVCVASDDDADVDPNEGGHGGGNKSQKRDGRPPDNRQQIQKPQAAAPANPPAATGSAAPAAAGDAPALSASQLNLIRAKCKAASLDEDTLCTTLGVGALDTLPAARVNEALDKIKGYANAAAGGQA